MRLNSETRLLLILSMFGVAGGGALVLLGRTDDAEPGVPVAAPSATMSRATFDSLVQNGRHIEGTAEAPLTIVEFADFQCPWCRHTYNELLKKYDIVSKAPARLVFYNLPITTAHLRAVPAAIAAEAAGRQGKFWPMYNLLFSGATPKLEAADVDRDASQIGLDLDRFHKDEVDPSVAAAVEADAQTAARNNIREAPTFLLMRARRSGDAQEAVGATTFQNDLSAILGTGVVPVAPPTLPAVSPHGASSGQATTGTV